MWGSIFAETLRRGWRTALYWALGLSFIGVLQISLVNSVESIQQFAEIMETMPPFLVDMFGGGDIEFMATPDGYLATRYFSIILLFFAFYAVTAGMNVTASDEDAGIMDIFMSLPVRRWQVVLEKLLAYALLSAGILLVTMLAQLAAIAAVPDLNYTVSRVIESNINLLPSLLLVLAVSVLLGALMRRKALAQALAAVFVAGSYMLDSFAAAAPDVLDPARAVSFFSYLDPVTVMKNGLVPGNLLVLLAVAVLAAGVAMLRYERRDIGL